LFKKDIIKDFRLNNKKPAQYTIFAIVFLFPMEGKGCDLRLIFFVAFLFLSLILWTTYISKYEGSSSLKDDSGFHIIVKTL